MRHLISFSFVFLFALNLSGQFGLRTGYGKSTFEQWNDQAYGVDQKVNGKFLASSAYVGLDYWFRLKKRRIEFLPSIGYSSYGNSDILNVNYKGSSFDASFNVNVYLLDLAEDCDCPTFSKQGNTIKKGFFVNIAPIGKMFSIQGRSANASQKVNVFGAGLRAGLGLDIGLSDFVTITPMLAYERTSMLDWKGMALLNGFTENGNDVSTNYSRLSGEVRLGMRFDGNNKRRRR